MCNNANKAVLFSEQREAHYPPGRVIPKDLVRVELVEWSSEGDSLYILDKVVKVDGDRVVHNQELVKLDSPSSAIRLAIRVFDGLMENHPSLREASTENGNGPD
ncbi:MAG: hypothetical protein ACYSVY_00315 [Planctomycetota bacterium]|jgi:hypothetical protein